MLNYGDISNMLHEKFKDLGFAASEHSDQPQHPPSLTMQSSLCALILGS